MTGRKGRIVQRDDGEIEYEMRHKASDVPLGAFISFFGIEIG